MTKLSKTLIIALAALSLAGGSTLAVAQEGTGMEQGIQQDSHNPTPVPPYGSDQGGDGLQQDYDAAE